MKLLEMQAAVVVGEIEEGGAVKKNSGMMALFGSAAEDATDSKIILKDGRKDIGSEMIKVQSVPDYYSFICSFFFSTVSCHRRPLLLKSQVHRLLRKKQTPRIIRWR